MTREIVFVTGGGGYIGSSVVHAFLHHPAQYIVRLGLRKKAQQDAYLKKYEKYASRLQFYLFSDMTTEGVFDQALEGVSYVAHLASSTNFEPEDNVRDVMMPGIMGMKNMLRAASLNSSVKGIAYTSGISAYYDCHDQGSPGDHFDATSFNPRTWDETAVLPRSRGVEVYNNTKVLVERMAWRYMEEHKPHFWLTTLGPMWVLGPAEIPLAVDAVDVGSAFELTYRHVLDTQVQQVEDLPYFVDIRDVADAHVICATDPRAAGKRYILSGGRYSYYEISRILINKFPEHKNRVCPYPRKDYAPTWTADTSDFEADVGFSWRSLESCVEDWGRQVLAMPKPTKAGRSDYTAQLDDRVYQPV